VSLKDISRPRERSFFFLFPCRLVFLWGFFLFLAAGLSFRGDYFSFFLAAPDFFLFSFLSFWQPVFLSFLSFWRRSFCFFLFSFIFFLPSVSVRFFFSFFLMFIFPSVVYTNKIDFFSFS
jgi:hypothetical protein